MSESGRFGLAPRAYVTMVRHAARFAARPVCGLLLRRARDGAENVGKGRGAASAGGGVALVAVPLFHSYPPAALMETALSQVEAYCAATAHELAGWYCAGERRDDDGIPPYVRRAAAVLEEKRPGSVVVVMDNTRVSHQQGDCALAAVYSSPDGGRNWGASPCKKNGADVLSADAESTIETLRQLLGAGNIVDQPDFEAHLDDASLVWLS